MVSGSLVSSLQGEPRSTHDIDIVVAIHESSAKPLAAAFPPPDYYLTEESILDALRTNGLFNLLDVNSGDKIDFWLLTDQPFDLSRFKRKRVEDVLGMRLAVSAPEDTILDEAALGEGIGRERQTLRRCAARVRSPVRTTGSGISERLGADARGLIPSRSDRRAGGDVIAVGDPQRSFAREIPLHERRVYPVDRRLSAGGRRFKSCFAYQIIFQ